MSDLVRQRLGVLVAAVPSPEREVRSEGVGWTACVWDETIALEIEVDPTQGLFLLVAAVGEDGRPHPGPYVDRAGRVVRRHVTEILPGTASDLLDRMRAVVGSWPYPELGDGDWDSLTSLCIDLWEAIHALQPFSANDRSLGR